MNNTQTTEPLVTVAITTYNRPNTLGQSITSVLNQSYENLEIIILDDCSSGVDTIEIVQQFINKDSRVKYYRHENRIGVNPNFNFAVTKANGKYFMWLCDDDWIDRDYINSCLNALIENRDCILITGKTKFYREDKFSHDGVQANLLNENSLNRWMSFYINILGSGNTPNFGVIELDRLRQFKMPNVMGCDYILFSRIAFVGKIKTLEEVCIHRRLGGMSKSMKSMAISFSLPGFDKQFGFLSLWINIFKDFLFNSSFKSLNMADKLCAAAKLNLLMCFNMPQYFKKYNMRGEIKNQIKLPVKNLL